MTDCWDRRCVMHILDDYYNENVLREGHKFDESGIYHQLHPDVKLSSYLEYIANLPTVDSPEIFGLHENANIAYGQRQAVQVNYFLSFKVINWIQPLHFCARTTTGPVVQAKSFFCQPFSFIVFFVP